MLLGDGESAEGSVWEAGSVGSADQLDNLCGITDVNGLGQSRATMWNHDMEQFARRGARSAGTPSSSTVTTSRPSSTRSTKRAARKSADDDSGADDQGQGRVVRRGKDGWHGKAFKKGEELDRAIAELEKQFVQVPSETTPRRGSV